jgi:hypothetical protein
MVWSTRMFIGSSIKFAFSQPALLLSKLWVLSENAMLLKIIWMMKRAFAVTKAASANLVLLACRIQASGMQQRVQRSLEELGQDVSPDLSCFGRILLSTLHATILRTILTSQARSRGTKSQQKTISSVFKVTRHLIFVVLVVCGVLALAVSERSIVVLNNIGVI